MVLSLPVCGDGLCDEDEMCSTCPADCGECPMTAAIKVAIGLPVTLVFISFLLTGLVRNQHVDIALRYLSVERRAQGPVSNTAVGPMVH